ncbi:MAG TPA: ABC transporter permease subunit [Candidatus Hydrogenedentes bacterium]|nr:ABC transporter permease subunit [Candidatus Hydrogenedentota bacterium]HPG66685.1 ABC transporter permease subunit [Candidatus Hydrogenedentota bacterium]
MIGRIWTAYTVELRKALRSASTYVGPVLVMLAVAGALVVHPVDRDGASDYGFVAYATPLALNLLGIFMTLVFCSGLVASELSHGTIRMVLVRPLLRREFLAAKLLLGMTYALGLVVLVAASAWGTAHALGDTAGVGYGGEILYTTSQMRWAYGAGMLLSMAPFAAAVSYAVFISTLTRSTGPAAALSLGLWLLVEGIKHPLGIEAYVFSTYLETPWRVFSGRVDLIDTAWFPEAKYCLGVSLAMALTFAFLSVYVLNRRNLNE